MSFRNISATVIFMCTPDLRWLSKASSVVKVKIFNLLGTIPSTNLRYLIFILRLEKSFL